MAMAAPATSDAGKPEQKPPVQLMLTGMGQPGEKPKISLQQAARDGREDVVRQWLARLLSYRDGSKLLDARDAEGYTAMHYAAKFNRFKIMHLLIAHGASCSVETAEDKLTPLHLAARYVPRYHDDATDQEAEMQDSAGPQEEATSTTATHLFTSRKTVTLLLHQKVDVNCKDLYGITPLHMACSRRNLAAVEVLLAHRNIDVGATDASDVTPLHEACLDGDKTIAKKLLEKIMEDKVEFLAKNDEDETPLHYACKAGHEDIVKLIIQFAILHENRELVHELVTAQDRKRNTPLHLACESGNDVCVRSLLVNGADIRTTKHDDITPLHVAARQGFIEVAETILKSGLDIIDILDAYQQTPLHYAAKFNQGDMVEFLLQKGAKIEAQDEHSYTPLLTAASSGKLDAFTALMEHGAAVDVVNKDGKSAVFVAAEANHVNILRKMISHKTGAKLFRTADFLNNTPLHVAAEKGNLAALKVLLQADVKEDARNELEKTAMHLAAERGHVMIVKELLRYRVDMVNHEDEDSNTPLHLACTSGHIGVAMELIEAKADVEARNAVLETPMHCAAEEGWDKMVTLLIEAKADIDPGDRTKVTPFHLSCREGHLSVVSVFLKSRADVTLVDNDGNNGLDLAIEYGHEEVAMAIIRSSKWQWALRNVTPAHAGKGETTPLRKLIHKMPAVAEEVLNRCTMTNDTRDGQIRPDSKEYKVIFNYEFVEDFRDPESRIQRALGTASRYKEMPKSWGTAPGSDYSSDEGDGSGVAETPLDLQAPADHRFSTSWGPLRFKKSAHPLNIMVESEQIGLLKHPLVTSLLDYKWTTYVQYVYFGNLFVYLLFLSFLTAFALVVLSPLSCTCQLVSQGDFGENKSHPLCASASYQLTNGVLDADPCMFDVSGAGNLTSGVLGGIPSEGCKCGDGDDIQQIVDTKLCGTCRGLSEFNEIFIYIAAVVVLGYAVFRLASEIFQFTQQRLDYLFDWVNWTEVAMCILSGLFAWVFHTDCLCPTEWQWQAGTVAVFLAWINLIVFIRKLPLTGTGIYVVMFVDIFYTFCRMIFLSALLVIAFGLAFYMALFEPDIGRTPFSTPARALVKTMTMTTGEFEYDAIFRQPSDPSEDAGDDLVFPSVSYTLWIFFLILMPILLTNLLVGLAVDDIKGVQETAALKRLALLVEITMNVEELLPRRVRRYFIAGSREVYPNRRLSPLEWLRYSVWGGHRFDSPEVITKALHPPLPPIQHVQAQANTLLNKVDRINERTEAQHQTVMDEVEQMKEKVDTMNKTMEHLGERIEQLIREMGGQRQPRSGATSVETSYI